jgi:hypothetical protein
MDKIEILCGMVIFLAGLAGTVSAQDQDLHLGSRQSSTQGIEVAPGQQRGLAGQLTETTAGGLSAEDIESLLKDAAGLIDPEAAALSLASANLTESEIGRQLGLLRKIQQDLFSAPAGESVESLFDAEFGDAAAPRVNGIDPQAVGSLISAYDRLHTALHVMKTYAFLAHGPVATYKGAGGSESVAAEAAGELKRARGEAQAALEALRGLLK